MSHSTHSRTALASNNSNPKLAALNADLSASSQQLPLRKLASGQQNNPSSTALAVINHSTSNSTASSDGTSGISSITNNTIASVVAAVKRKTTAAVATVVTRSKAAAYTSSASSTNVSSTVAQNSGSALALSRIPNVENMSLSLAQRHNMMPLSTARARLQNTSSSSSSSSGAAAAAAASASENAPFLKPSQTAHSRAAANSTLRDLPPSSMNAGPRRPLVSSDSASAKAAVNSISATTSSASSNSAVAAPVSGSLSRAKNDSSISLSMEYPPPSSSAPTKLSAAAAQTEGATTIRKLSKDAAIAAEDELSSSRKRHLVPDEQATKRPREVVGNMIVVPELDAADIEDAGMCAEYAQDIIEYLLQREQVFMPDPGYILKHPELKWHMRALLVDWLLEIHYRFKFLPETLFLGINIMDRVLSRRACEMNRLQLLGLTALFIAAKTEEVITPQIQQFAFMIEDNFNESFILEAEQYILRVLDYVFWAPGPFSFIRRISKVDEYNFLHRTLAKFFAEVSLMEHTFLKYPPSQIAAASMWLARTLNANYGWSSVFVYASGYEEAELMDVVELMLEYLTRKHEAGSFFVQKYSSKRCARAIQGAVQMYAEFKSSRALKVSPHLQYLRREAVPLQSNLSLSSLSSDAVPLSSVISSNLSSTSALESMSSEALDKNELEANLSSASSLSTLSTATSSSSTSTATLNAKSTSAILEGSVDVKPTVSSSTSILYATRESKMPPPSMKAPSITTTTSTTNNTATTTLREKVDVSNQENISYDMHDRNMRDARPSMDSGFISINGSDLCSRRRSSSSGSMSSISSHQNVMLHEKASNANDGGLKSGLLPASLDKSKSVAKAYPTARDLRIVPEFEEM